ncbi:hypothetical protein FB567DRAFT_551681 [Paraphoma chrysanthemicola]|uniref:Uncharacterized protein n=1 Tax=Paraphoma chrysanthemicola TaxID=798071 RepID=A0A8K0VVT0_9PLEO|nr:hypothetical protein FB567DRAFT_551681 [Paraphoma chrysanthemicola]
MAPNAGAVIHVPTPKQRHKAAANNTTRSRTESGANCLRNTFTDRQRFDDELALRDDIARHLDRRADNGTYWWNASASQQTNPRVADIRRRIKREIAAILMIDYDIVLGRNTTLPTTNNRSLAPAVNVASRSRYAIETNSRGRSHDIDSVVPSIDAATRKRHTAATSRPGRSHDIDSVVTSTDEAIRDRPATKTNRRRRSPDTDSDMDSDIDNIQDGRTHPPNYPRLDASVEARIARLTGLIESKDLDTATKDDELETLRRKLSTMTDKYNSPKAASHQLQRPSHHVCPLIPRPTQSAHHPLLSNMHRHYCHYNHRAVQPMEFMMSKACLQKSFRSMQMMLATSDIQAP